MYRGRRGVDRCAVRAAIAQVALITGRLALKGPWVHAVALGGGARRALSDANLRQNRHGPSAALLLYCTGNPRRPHQNRAVPLLTGGRSSVSSSDEYAASSSSTKPPPCQLSVATKAFPSSSLVSLASATALSLAWRIKSHMSCRLLPGHLSTTTCGKGSERMKGSASAIYRMERTYMMGHDYYRAFTSRLFAAAPPVAPHRSPRHSHLPQRRAGALQSQGAQTPPR